MSPQQSSGPPDLPDHIPALDGLRGVAILLVIYQHTFRLTEDRCGALARYEIGWTGVDLFFALSGFLITGILLDSRGGPHYFRTFYARRALRIFPLYYAALILTWLVTNVWRPSRTPPWPTSDYLLYWVYLQNWSSLIPGGSGLTGPLGHFWSLAVEEQFYLIWPLVVYHLSPKRLIAVCTSLFLFSFGLRYYLLVEGVPWTTVYPLTVTRLDSLCMGAILAAYPRSGYSVRSLYRCVWPALVLASAAIVVIALRDNGFRFWKDRCWTLKFGPSVLAVFYSAILLAAVSGRGPRFVQTLCNQSLLRLAGKYSYCMYVVHMPIADYLAPVLADRAMLPRGSFAAGAFGFLITGVCSAAIAKVSWRAYEEPILRLKRYFPTPRPAAPVVPERQGVPQPTAVGSG